MLLAGIVEGLLDVLNNDVTLLLGTIVDAYVAIGADIRKIKAAIHLPYVNFDFK